MNFLCNNCRLNHNIEKYRLILNKLLCKESLSLLDREVIRLSQLLDELLVECVTCKKSLKVAKKMNLD